MSLSCFCFCFLFLFVWVPRVIISHAWFCALNGALARCRVQVAIVLTTSFFVLAFFLFCFCLASLGVLGGDKDLNLPVGRGRPIHATVRY